MKRRTYLKGWVTAVFLLLSVSGAVGQSVSDDIQQLLLDVEKLSQLKQIMTEMYQEYTMLYNGYEKIKGLSQGTYSLHKGYLDGLLLVGPAVSNYYKVADIIAKEANLIKSYQAASSYFRGSGLFSSQELEGLSVFYSTVVERAERDIAELTMIITGGTLRMSDGERLSAIDRIDGNVTGQLSLLHGYNNSAALQAAQRARAAGDIGAVRDLYGIGP
ncbi:MAG TPA: TerB family tellurite resistance protein [Puia sp.]|jgi:hypothetical protein|nr:TerB family tellurite resistance protein [Puia sp.]